jgi:uncharacterized protein
MTTTSLPAFRYHPDPIATKSIVESDKQCACCEQARGYIYVAPVYAVDDLDDSICPWCIADGSAAKKFDATFVDDHPLHNANIASGIIDEVSTQTPGFFSWQQEVWLTCCADACEFHGDATKNDLTKIEAGSLERLLDDLGLEEGDWPSFVAGYEQGGDPGVYKFVCRHCKKNHYGGDFS